MRHLLRNRGPRQSVEFFRAPQCEPEGSSGVTYWRWDGRLPPWPKELAELRQAVFPQWADEADRPTSSWVVSAHLEGRTLGYVRLIRCVGEPGACIIDEVAVSESHRSQGLGRELVTRGLAWMRQLRFVNVYATPLVGSGHDRRVKWLESLDFQTSDGHGYTKVIGDGGSLAEQDYPEG